MVSIGLYDKYNLLTRGANGASQENDFPERSYIEDFKILDPFFNAFATGSPCVSQITDCFFDGNSDDFLPPYNPRNILDENGEITGINKFLPEVGLIVKLPYLKAKEPFEYAYYSDNYFYPFQSFSLIGKNGNGFAGNTFANHLFGVITTDENKIYQSTSSGYTNTFIDNAIAGIVIEPFRSINEQMVGSFQLFDKQLFSISTKYFERDASGLKPFEFQLNKFPFQAPIIYDEIDRDKAHGIIGLGRPIGVLGHLFNLSTNSSQSGTVGFKGNILSNEIYIQSTNWNYENCAILNNTFGGLEKGIVLTSKDFPGYVDNDRNYRLRIKNNTFQGLSTSIEMQPELFTEPNNSSLPAPFRISYYMELNCNIFSPSSNGGTGMLINPDVILTNIGYMNPSPSASNHKLSGNIWPAIAGTDRSVLEFDGVHYYSPNHSASNRGWEKPTNWNPIINNGSSEVTYFGYFNEFIDESLNVVGNNVRLSPRDERVRNNALSTVYWAATTPVTSGLPNSTVVCSPNLGQELYPLPQYFISNGNNPSKFNDELEIGITEERLVTFIVSEPNQEIKWRLHDISGKAIRSGTVKGNTVLNPYQNLNLPKGTYFIRATTNSTTKSKILVL